MTHAKLINGQLTYSTNFEKIGDDWVSNPTDEQLKAAGYKTLTYKEVDEVVKQYEETDTEIIVLTQKYIPNDSEVPDTSEELTAEVQPTLEQRVTNIEQVTTEVITALNEKGIVQ